MPNPEINVLLQEARVLAQQGDALNAKELYQQVCKLDESNFEAWQMLGGINGMQGDFVQAEACCRKAISLNQESLQAWFNLANTLRAQGQLPEAIAAYREAIAINGQSFAVLLALGTALLDAYEFGDAHQSFTKAKQLQPANPEVDFYLGVCLFRQGVYEPALDILQPLLKKHPKSVSMLIFTAAAQHALGMRDEALQKCRSALVKNGDNAEVWVLAGGVFLEAECYLEAEQSYLKALKCNENRPEAYYGVAEVKRQHGDNKAAIENCRQALKIYPDYIDALLSLGSNLLALAEPDEAMECARKVLHLDAQHPQAVALATDVLERKGQVGEAYDYLRPFIEKSDLNPNIALSFASLAGKKGCRQEAVDYIERVLTGTAKIAAPHRRVLHFSMGKLCDASADYDRAFEHFRKGNELKRVSCNVVGHKQEISRLMSVFSEGPLGDMQRAQNNSELPVFVVGMPRSGTSLVEQILSSHLLVYGAGELPYMAGIVKSLSGNGGIFQKYPDMLPEMGRSDLDVLAEEYLSRVSSLSPEATRIIDKMPGNYLYLGLIQQLFPAARVIHCKRDALDTCLSNYFQDFAAGQEFSYDLKQVAEVYLQYERIMEHWKQELALPILDIQYEELVSDTEGLSRAMVDFCGLDWDERCLRFYEEKRFVTTASYDQVRGPIYSKSVARWKHYKRHLGEPISILGGDYV